MNGLSVSQLVIASVYFIPAFAWTVVVQNGWRYLRTRHPHSRFFRMLPLVGALPALAYAVLTLNYLVPPEWRERGHWSVSIYLLNDCLLFAALAVGRHAARFFPTPEGPPPGRLWLAFNYGSCALAIVLAAGFHMLTPAPSHELLVTYRVTRTLYQLLMIALIAARLIRSVRPGNWLPGSAVFARRADALMLATGLAGIGVALVLNARSARWGYLLDFVVSMALVAPLAGRILAEVVRKFIVTATMLAIAGGMYFGVQPWRTALAGTEAAGPLDIATVSALVLMLVPGQAWLRTGIDRVVFRRRRRRRDELQAFLHSLSPEIGASECCRRVVCEVTRLMQLRGAAIVLRDGSLAMHGTIALAPLAPEWARNICAESLPAHALVGYELRELPLPLQEALSTTDIVGVVSINGRRQGWGVLLISTGWLAAAFNDEDEQVLQSFADQFALLLDSAELLSRAVAVERSLAHAERLAAIGELAARIAHEIRNPVTAARSLAQQLSRESASPFSVEHGLILAELERVERQVAALLRFARRDEFHFEAVDLSELARSVVERFHPLLAAGGIGVELDVVAGVVAEVDREKIRQVLINLIENAVDAMRSSAGVRRLALAVRSANGTATLQVTDSGPGVPPEALPHLFEPFFSLKEHGTGLGLAIAKRTIEAHGGRIAAAHASGEGMTFHIEVPLASQSRSTA